MTARLRLIWLALIAASTLTIAQTTTSNIPYVDAKPILDALRTDLLPPELQSRTPGDIEATWPGWVSTRDAQIRARLEEGDQDSIVNFLLFGVTFTKQPRMTAREILVAASQGRTADIAQSAIVQGRIADLIAALASPGASERLQFVRRVIEAKGVDPTTPAGRNAVREYLAEGLQRALAEYEAYARAPAPEQSVRFGDRGLSSDTSIQPGFAIEQGLETIKARRLLGAGSVRRIAIVGPGLDFTDKREGYDFYPEQTLQPFAVIDSLFRLDLAKVGDVRTTTFDLSPRVNQHLNTAQQRARMGDSYVLHLPRDTDRPWTPDLVAYWERLGNWIGEQIAPVAPPSRAGNVDVRAVRVPSAVTLTITPRDANIVLQRLDLAAGERFDLVIATNLFVYYDVFERSLALVNVGEMLRPGGLFLANNTSPAIVPASMELVGYSETAYSSLLNDRDRIDWYRRR